MRRIRQLLPAAMESPEVLRAGRAIAILKRWPEIVGESLAERSWPDRYSDGTVWVAVEGAAWANELRLMKEKILTRLCDIAREDGLFRDVRFGQRPLPIRPAQEEAPAESTEMPRDTTLSIREIAERRLAKRRNEEQP